MTNLRPEKEKIKMNDLQKAIEITRKTGIKVSDRGLMLCPFHDDKNPSGGLYLNKFHDQVEYHCFACVKSYKFETFYKLITDEEFRKEEAGKKKIQYLDSDVLDIMGSKLNSYLLTLLEDKDFKDQKHPLAKVFAREALKYLKSRGFAIAHVKKYQIGFITAKMARNIIEIRGYSWIKDPKRECFLVYPIRDENNRTVTMQFEDFMNRGKLEKTKFFLSKPIASWFSETPTNKEEDWVVCESIYDAMSFDSIGKKAIALMGQPSAAQIAELKKFKSLILALDNDEAGWGGKAKLSKELYSTSSLKEVVYPEGVKDPNELYSQEGGYFALQGLIYNTQEIDLYPTLFKTIDFIVLSYEEMKEKTISIPTEFQYLKKYLSDGFAPGLYALAGMPAVGKTTFLNQISDALAKNYIHTVYFLTEEPAYRLLERTIKKEGLSCFKELKDSQEDILKYRRVFEMDINYTADKLKDILAGIKSRLEEDKLVFIIDSLQALRLSQDLEKSWDTRAKTIQKTEYLAHIARDLKIPVIFVSFMAREFYSYNKEKKTPNIGVFKESGDIEYLIDCGLALWVKENILQENEPEIKLYFVKNRFGKCGSVSLRFIKRECKFEESQQ